MKCNHCGQTIEDTAAFCRFCGASAAPAVPVAPAAPAAEPVSEQPAAQPSYQEPAWQPAYQPQYNSAPVYAEPGNRPMLQLPTGRGLAKLFFLGILTLSIYPTVVWSRMITELNITASRYDGRRTMPYFAAGILAPLTLGIYPLVWIHGVCNRMGYELIRRNIPYKFSASTFWLWNVLGSLILVGPFVYLHKFCKAMNLINADFNQHG